jgi:DNA polymerase-3 subunit alpha
LPNIVDEVQGIRKRKSDPQMGLFGEVEDSDSIQIRVDTEEAREWSEKEKMLYEKECLGFYITGHPLDVYNDLIKIYTNVNTADLIRKRGGDKVRLAGVAASIQEKRTRRDDVMALVKLEDRVGIVDVIVFPNTHSDCEHTIRSGEPFLVVGKVEKGDRSVKIVAEEVIPFAEVRERLAREVVIVFRSEVADSKAIRDIKELLIQHRGPKKVKMKYILNGSTEIIIDLPEEFAVSPSSDLAIALKNRLGYDSFDIR